MEDDLGAARSRPPDGLGIAPAFVADRDAELGPVDVEELPAVPWDVEPILGRVELGLGLTSLDPPLGVDDDGSDLSARLGEPFRPEDRRNRERLRPACHGLENAILVRPVERRDVAVLYSQA